MGMDPTGGIQFVDNSSRHIRSVDPKLSSSFQQDVHEAGGAVASMGQSMFFMSGWGWEKDQAVAYAKPGQTETGQAAPEGPARTKPEEPKPLAINQPLSDPNGIVGQTINVKGV